MPLPVRSSPAPPGATVIIRGGVMNADNVRRSASRTMAVHGVLGLSVVGVIGTSVQEVCRRDERVRRYRHIRLSTFGRLAEAEFGVIATLEHPHFTIVLPDLADLTVLRLDRCFEEPIPNPGRRTGVL